MRGFRFAWRLFLTSFSVAFSDQFSGYLKGPNDDDGVVDDEGEVLDSL